jgi:hypothetical protein
MVVVVTLFDCVMSIAVLAMAYWPPFVLMFPIGKEDRAWYDGAAKLVMMLPSYRILEVETFAMHLLFCLAVIFSVAGLGPGATDPVVISALFLAFLRITLCHVARAVTFRYRAPIPVLVIEMMATALSVTMVVLYGISWRFVSVGLCVGVVFMDLVFVAAAVNWYMANGIRRSRSSSRGATDDLIQQITTTAAV